MQAEETHNTLKFATRASAVKIAAVRNRLSDEQSQLLAHQAQIRDLKAQLARLQAEAQPVGADVDTMQARLPQYLPPFGIVLRAVSAAHTSLSVHKALNL